MDNNFNPQAIEQSLYAHWEKSAFFKANDSGEGYCILIPPPNVTGTLHMGHAFNQTLMDTLIRYHRMQGAGALWQMGTDHAGYRHTNAGRAPARRREPQSARPRPR